MADLLGARRPRRRLRPQHDPAHLRHRPHARRDVGARRRGGRHPPRPRREHPAVGHRRRGGRRHRALGRVRPGTGELTRGRRGAVLSDAHPAGRGHRRVEPARHPARRARASPTWRTPSARWSTSTGCTTPRTPPFDVSALGADFYACSPYKFLGPHCGVLAADPALLETLRPDKLLPSTDAVPGAVRARHAALRAARRHHGGRRLPRRDRERPRVAPRAAPGVDGRPRGLRGRPARPDRGGPGRLPASPCTPAPRPHPDAARHGRPRAGGVAFLAARGVNAPAGSFYALEASRRLGLGDTGALRVGLAPYVDDTDVDRLLEGSSSSAGRADEPPRAAARRARPGVRVGLPAPTRGPGERRAHRGAPGRDGPREHARCPAGARDEPPADLLPARRPSWPGRSCPSRAARCASGRAGRPTSMSSVAAGGLRGRRGTTRHPCRRMPSWRVTSPSCPASWMPASSTASACGPRRVASTVGGSPPGRGALQGQRRFLGLVTVVAQRGSCSIVASTSVRPGGAGSRRCRPAGGGGRWASPG